MNVGSRPATPEEALDWLTTHVRLDGDCRVWAGTVESTGTPRVWWNLRRHSAQRLLLDLLGRSVHPTDVVWVGCEHRNCMNPEHLRVGSRRTYNQWASKEGRLMSGMRRSLVVAMSRSAHAKLGVTQRNEVIDMRNRGMTQKAIGEVYGVSRSAVSAFLRRWERLDV